MALASTEQLLEAYYAYLKRKRTAPATIKRWKPELRRFAHWLAGRPAWSVSARELELGFLVEWELAFEERNGREASASSVATLITALKSFYEFLDRFDYLQDADGHPVKDPMRKIEKPKREAKPIQWLRADEDDALLEACVSLRERIIVGFYRYTGMRLDEGLSLTNDDIDLLGGSVYVGGRSKSAAGLGREIPLNPERSRSTATGAASH